MQEQVRWRPLIAGNPHARRADRRRGQRGVMNGDGHQPVPATRRGTGSERRRAQRARSRGSASMRPRSSRGAPPRAPTRAGRRRARDSRPAAGVRGSLGRSGPAATDRRRRRSPGVLIGTHRRSIERRFDVGSHLTGRSASSAGARPIGGSCAGQMEASDSTHSWMGHAQSRGAGDERRRLSATMGMRRLRSHHTDTVGPSPPRMQGLSKRGTILTRIVGARDMNRRRGRASSSSIITFRHALMTPNGRAGRVPYFPVEAASRWRHDGCSRGTTPAG